MDKVNEPLRFVKHSLNQIFINREPWQIVTITATTVLSTVWLYNVLREEEPLTKRFKKRLFKLIRKFPAVQKKINTEINKATVEFEKSTIERTKGVSYITKLPFKSLSDEDILKKLDQHLELGHFNWKDGHVSGAVYKYDEKLISLLTAVIGKTMYTNPLHCDVFPGVCKMEAEVIRMTAKLFNGNADTCGSITTGGTESILMACKAYRDYAREEKGITNPTIVMPITAHSAFDKASQYLGLVVKTAKIDSETTKVDLRAMEKLITKNTIMLVGSVPNFPYGTVDDIRAIAALGLKYNIPVHVDACLGGFLIPFMKRAGYPLSPFDFSVKGVTSISADTHKFGFTPKGSSIILYSDLKYRNCQYTVTTDWPGGVYGSPSVSGSRAGSVVAATWATLLSFGEDGYTEATKRIVDTAKHIEQQLKNIKGIFIFGTPATSVIAFGSNVFDIFRLSELLSDKGWNLNTLQFPSGIHICVTSTHTNPGVADLFINDVRECVAQCMINPDKPVEGKMAFYGLAQTVPDRSVVGDITKCFLNSVLYTPPE